MHASISMQQRRSRADVRVARCGTDDGEVSAMPYADGLLANGETIVRRERQHWIFPFYLAGRWVALAVGVTVLGFVLGQFVFKSDGTGIIAGAIGFINTVISWITFIALVIAVVGFVWAVVLWVTQEYVLTNMRVLHVRGVINKQSSDSSLETITDAAITIPWLGRILGFGDLKVMTASEAGIEKLRALRDPIGFKKNMMETKHALMVDFNRQRPPLPTTVADTPAPAPAPPVAVAPVPAPVAPAPAPGQTADEVTDTLAKLAQLRDSGAITPEEYNAKKQELLGRI
jgi:hypothetical protein